MSNIECYMCGACCVAYSISTMNKKGGVPCLHLQNSRKCGNYEKRPQVCRDFKADNLCVLISTLKFEEKVHVLTKVYMD